MTAAPAIVKRLPSLDDVQRARATRSLERFIEIHWSAIDPAPYKSNWHIGAIAEHLEAVSAGEIRRLLINMPPRCMKSISVAVAWPAWGWILRPETQWLFASFAEKLSLRDSVKCRALIQSSRYQRYHGDAFRLAKDQNTKGRFENDKMGSRIATSFGGTVTGDGGDMVVLDDPIPADAEMSEAVLDGARERLTGTFSSRGNDSRTSAFVMVMQRLHQKDPSAHVLSLGGWEHLMLPMHYDPKRSYVTCIGTDPRTEPGELLWPERFPEESVEQLRREMTPTKARGQLEQDPIPGEGGLFQRQWFGDMLPAAPAGHRTVRYWDWAATKKQASNDPDWTAGVKMTALPNGQYVITDIKRIRDTPAVVDALVTQTAQLDGKGVRILFEEEGGSAGKNMTQKFARLLAGYHYTPIRSTGAKETRIGILSAPAQVGNLKLVQGPWNEDFLAEAEYYPNGAHDDQLDAAAGAYAELAEPTGETSVIQHDWRPR